MRLLPALALLPGCFVLVGDGHPVTEARVVDAFDRVEAQGFVRVEVTLDAPGLAEVTCDENLLGRVHTDVVDGTLVVRTDPVRSMLGARGCTVEVSTPNVVEVSTSGSGGVIVHGVAVDFERAWSSGSGDLRLDAVRGADVTVVADGSGAVTVGAVRADALDAWHGGSGDLALTDLDVDDASLLHGGSGHAELTGATPRLDLESTGSGGVHAGALVAEDVVVRASGSGSVFVHATDRVTGRLSGSGDVEVAGGARIDVADTGSGRVIRR